MGWKMEENKKVKKNRKKLMIALVLILALGIGGIFYKKKSSPFGDKSLTREEIDDRSYKTSKIMRADFSDIKTIKFDLENCDVRIQKSNTNPYIEYTNLYKDDTNACEINIDKKGNDFVISSKIKGDPLYMKNKIQVVRIFLPKEGSLDKISGTINQGDVKFTDFDCKDMDLAISSGNIIMDNSYFGGSLATKVGSISITNSKISQGKMGVAAGNILLDKTIVDNDLALSTEAGNIDISTSDKIGKYNIDAKVEVGDLVLGSVSYRNLIDGLFLDNGSKKVLTLRSKVGDISFNKGEGMEIERKETPLPENSSSKSSNEGRETEREIEDENN